MKEFFGKLKNGIKKTGQGVKKVVYVNRSRLEAGQKRADIEEGYYDLGKAAYASYVNGREFKDMEKVMIEHCRKLEDIEKEYRSLTEKIKENSRTKKCRCGATVMSAAKFCPYCGYKFP